MSERNDRPSKKPYRPPELRVYGDIHAITQTVSRVAGKMDGTGFFAKKTR